MTRTWGGLQSTANRKVQLSVLQPQGHTFANTLSEVGVAVCHLSVLQRTQLSMCRPLAHRNKTTNTCCVKPYVCGNVVAQQQIINMVICRSVSLFIGGMLNKSSKFTQLVRCRAGLHPPIFTVVSFPLLRVRPLS